MTFDEAVDAAKRGRRRRPTELVVLERELGDVATGVADPGDDHADRRITPAIEMKTFVVTPTIAM